MPKQKPQTIYHCQHCKKEVKIFRGRKLCYWCHKDPAIRKKYPRDRTGGTYRAAGQEPTEEELDAMIADRMRNLPAWWYKRNGEHD